MRYLDKEDREEVINDFINRFKARLLTVDRLRQKLAELGLRDHEIDDIVRLNRY